mmetsp:Transcript_9909/g.32461  ORF Transcript_9909/g.32461 Transcript_9909/m.32461 type:complete len:221 (-) Transcript_9909:239-901(-)
MVDAHLRHTNRPRAVPDGEPEINVARLAVVAHAHRLDDEPERALDIGGAASLAQQAVQRLERLLGERKVGHCLLSLDSDEVRLRDGCNLLLPLLDEPFEKLHNLVRRFERERLLRLALPLERLGRRLEGRHRRVLLLLLLLLFRRSRESAPLCNLLHLAHQRQLLVHLRPAPHRHILELEVGHRLIKPQRTLALPLPEKRRRLPKQPQAPHHLRLVEQQS